MTPTLLRAGMSDLVAVAFYRLGYRPRESLLLVGVHGPRGRMGVIVRSDLPSPPHERSVISVLLEALLRNGDDQVVGLVVSDDAVQVPGEAGPLRMPRRTLVGELRRQVVRQGMRLLDVLAVGPSRWRSYRCSDPGCCPPQGFPVDAALTGPAAAQFVALGRVLEPDEEALVADVAPSPRGDVDGAARTGEGVTAAPGEGGSRDDGGDGHRLAPADAAQALERWRGLLAAPARATPPELAWLATVLDDHWVRDSVLLTLIPGAGTLPEEVLAGADASAVDAAFTTGPDPELLERGRGLLAAVARAAPPGRRADALALLAWAAWWSGNGVRGRLLVTRALADVPGHRLATLIDGLLTLGVAPGWTGPDLEGCGRGECPPGECAPGSRSGAADGDPSG